MPNSKERLQIRLAQLGLILSHPFEQLGQHRIQPPPPHPESILLIRLDHLGDLVMSQPAIAAIRAHFPGARLTLLCASWNIPIAALIPGIDEILTLNAPWHRGGDKWSVTRKFIRDTRNRRFDAGIALRQWLGDLWLLSRLNCDWRLGYSMVGIKPRLSYAMPLPCEPMHATDLMLNLLIALGVPAVPGTAPALVPTAKGEQEAAEFMGQKKMEAGRFFAMHLESRQKPRSWLLFEAIGLASLLWEKFKLPTVLLGGKEETERYDEAVRGHDFVINAAGKITLQGSFSLLGRAKAFVGVDSGPAHLAAAAGIPTLVLWSGQVPQHLTKPRGKAVKVIQNPCPKAPCYHMKCPYPHTPCMKAYTAESVLGELESLLSQS